MGMEAEQPKQLAQGYAAPWHYSAHAACTQQAKRRLGASLLPAAVPLGSLRVSAPGWEGWVLDGLQARSPAPWHVYAVIVPRSQTRNFTAQLQSQLAQPKSSDSAAFVKGAQSLRSTES